MPKGPLVSYLCDVVLNDLAKSQVPRLEVLLHQLGQQVYASSHPDEDKKAGLTGLRGEPSPVVSETASVFSNGDVKVTKALEYALAELMTTERSYVARLEALYNRYATPLLQLAKDKDTQIIPSKEAEAIFSNVGDILAANKMMLVELEVEYEQGPQQLASVVGDILLRNMHMFDCYVAYSAHFERAQHTYNQMLKHRGFREYIERTQHSTHDLGNAGLRELMIEPMQRIPRYQLLISNLLKHYPTESTQAQQLQDASAVATIIASRRLSEGERQAAVLWSCQRTINRFPPELSSPGRELLGCIDVDEPTSETAPSKVFTTLGSVLGRRSRSSLALLVFTDVLVLVQRHSRTPTHLLLGVHDPDALAERMRTSYQSAPTQSKRSDLTFAGMVDLMDVCATSETSRELQFVFERTLRGSNNKVLLRRFVDAMPDTDGSHIALFLECLWRAQAVHRARGTSLAVRESTSISACGPLTMFWTLYTRSQYQRLEAKERLLLYIGATDSRLLETYKRSNEICVALDLKDEVDACTVTISRDWGIKTRRALCSLRDVPRVCADLLVLPTIPPLPEAPAPTPAALVPTKAALPRSKPLRGERRAVPGVHRARSLVSDRIRASIQSSLEAMQESERQSSTALAATRKRSGPLADVSNVESPKRRAVRGASHGSENVAMHETPLADKKADALTDDAAMSEVGTPTRKSHTQLSMYADDTLDLPNPFHDQSAVSHPSPILPEPAKPGEEDDEMPDVRAAADASLATKSDGADVSAATHSTADAARPDEAAAAAAQSMAEDEMSTSTSTSSATATATATATVPEDVDAMDERASLADSAPTTPSEAAEAEAEADEVPPAVPGKDTAKLRDYQVTEEEMQAMLRPLLEHIQVAPRQQPIVHAGLGPTTEPKQAEIVPAPLDISYGALSTVPEEDGQNVATSDLDRSLRVRVPMPSEDVSLLPDTRENVGMREAIKHLNHQITLLRRYRPAKQTAEWAQDWAQFKQAVKQLNYSWTDMERAYEDNQMELASLRLAQPEHDDRVHLTREEYTDIQDQLNAILPLRLQIQKLTKRCMSLKELEKDARRENAELYHVFNEELGKLYQHSFRPAHDEIELLRKELIEAKEEISALRTENRALRLHNVMGDS
ncbi:guanyl-nucleotide exchange factor protein [Malassezia pachydermatis]